jgi:transcription antitermination factor NusG
MSLELYGEQWFALQVRARWERSTSNILGNKGYQILLPTCARHQHRNGQESSIPLFPGYVFCRFNGQKRLPILITPGVIAVVGRGRVPVPVERTEIEAIQAMVSSGLPLDPWPYMEVGQRVRIENHALRGLEGILIAFKGGHRIVVSVSLLRRSVALEIDRALVNPIGMNRDAAVHLLPSYELAIA